MIELPNRLQAAQCSVNFSQTVTVPAILNLSLVLFGFFSCPRNRLLLVGTVESHCLVQGFAAYRPHDLSKLLNLRLVTYSMEMWSHSLCNLTAVKRAHIKNPAQHLAFRKCAARARGCGLSGKPFHQLIWTKVYQTFCCCCRLLYIFINSVDTLMIYWLHRFFRKFS